MGWICSSEISLSNRSIQCLLQCSKCSIGMRSAYLVYIFTILSINRSPKPERHTRNVNTCTTEFIFFCFNSKSEVNPGVEVVSICEIVMDILDVPSCRCINKETLCEKKKTRKIQINLSSLHACYVVSNALVQTNGKASSTAIGRLASPPSSSHLCGVAVWLLPKK